MYIRLALLIFLLLAQGSLAARSHDKENGHRELSREQAAAIARKRHPGKVLSVRRIKGKKPPAYRVKILSKGDVRVIRVP
ncbi:PepSY domain-containing protein [Solemya elarraichensis gill symbiont]|uniref:PepSY domain-containing protein n=1 Tax=Solemya elarraichensis gill symbiont TaxID=1918949 RepID=A0A1T2L1C0_9GAMM|nr:PepSY domain-containing protein [Solemya elarraichensis gill symbiont]OOZ38862.1 hypothetical protein BOW52_07970 [Solemya elarraichensis gill symbiont]